MNKFFVAIVASLIVSHASFSAPPNVIVILADDLGWSDTTLYNHTSYYQTPNVERLAKRGMTFTRAYSASPLCSPTRSALLTGQSPARTGITSPNCHLPQVVLQATTNTKAAPDQKAIQPTTVTRLKTEYRTLAETFKEAGYATAHFGKWHLGAEPYSPLQQGFDFDLPHHSGPGPAGSYVAPWKFANFKEKSENEHIEDRMAAEAVEWISQQKDQPFYLNYWMFSVHAPFDGKKANVDKHRSRIDPSDAQRSPTYAAMIESMDDAIGTLLDELDRLKIADNTIIVFTSDNGGNMYNEIDGTTPTSNRPLRGGKATMFEGGTRVPGVIVWPGIARAGSRSEAIIQSEDYYPTLLDGLQLQPAEGQHFDGASILPALRGSSLAGKAIVQYFPHAPGVPDWLPPAVSIHRDDWKLIRIFHQGENGTHRHLLFNLRDDLGERSNLAASRPELVVELDGLIEKFLSDADAVLPVPNPNFDPTMYHPELEGKQKSKAADNLQGKNKSKADEKDVGEVTLKGWKVRGCSVTVKNGVATVIGKSEAPFLGVSASLSGPATVTLRVRSATSGIGKIEWIAPESQSKKESFPSVPFAFSDDWQEISVSIPTQDRIGILRVYLPSHKDPIELDWIALESASVKKRWDF